ncbi:MAG: NifU family protein [Bdellovibrionales bacterium]|nr:NifU family protein [Bdellovibrionales bacterium]
MSTKEIEVFYEATPNPQSMKFNFTQQMAEESLSFNSIEEAQRSPLAQKIFGFPWTAAVHVGPSFITVTKQEWVEWKILADPLSDLIREHLQSGLSLLLPPVSEEATCEIEEDEDPIVFKIKSLLNEQVRPAVAQDGGDIQYVSYNEGVLYVRMMGACSGCPSSMITLKEGIEAHLKELIPELKSVEAV